MLTTLRCSSYTVIFIFKESQLVELFAALLKICVATFSRLIHGLADISRTKQSSTSHDVDLVKFITRSFWKNKKWGKQHSMILVIPFLGKKNGKCKIKNKGRSALYLLAFLMIGRWGGAPITTSRIILHGCFFSIFRGSACVFLILISSSRATA